MNGPVDRPQGALHGLPEGLLWGRTVRPPATGWDGRRQVGSGLSGSRSEAVGAQAGVVAVLQQGSFLGVVAITALYARQAAADLAPVWRAEGRAVAAPAPGAADYSWRMVDNPDAQPGPVAVWCLNGHVRVWLPPCPAGLLECLHLELAQLLSIAPQNIRFSALAGEAAGDSLDLIDAVSDAALLSRAVGRPVGIALTPHACAGQALVLRIAPAGDKAEVLDLGDRAVAPLLLPTLQSDSPWAVRPSLARLLTQPSAASVAHASAVPDGLICSGGLATDLVAAGVHALNAAQVFAQESLWYEQAIAQGEAPLAWRRRHLPDGAGAVLARRVTEGAGWTDAAPPLPAGADGSLRGRGFATARMAHTAEDGSPQILWSAWVAEVAVHPSTGQVEVLRVVAGQDRESLDPVQGVPVDRVIVGENPLLLDDARQLFTQAGAFDDWKSPARELTVPNPDTHLASFAQNALAPGQLRVDRVLSLPAAAAIANAIHDATGVRLRQIPFETEQLRLALAGARSARARGLTSRGATWWAIAAAGIAGLVGAAWPVRSALPLTSGPDVSVYSRQAIERGRLVASAGDCVVCHTAPGGRPNAGGLGLDTPFGTVYSTNITPDTQTGIGRWSYAAFERAMRQGIHQDGRHLYPAFPYTAFARMSDGDVQSLYAYLMSEPAVSSKAPETRLAFPYNLRFSLAGWNLLFHDATPFKADARQTAEWNRGAYLVQGVGHCAACHSPRNALGAEKSGLSDHLAGGEAEGWTAPPLNQLAGGKTPWRREELENYLRTGFSPRHGVAAGPMAPVIHGLAALPESDVRAMATYLLQLPGSAPAGIDPVPAEVAATAAPTALRHLNGERIYQNACAVCHSAGSGPTLFGVKPDLAFNTNLRAGTPDNLVQTILHGIQNPANGELGYMPGFKNSLDDRQVAELVAYLRQRFAPGDPAWSDPARPIARIRLQGHE